jgi:glycosyltransferase involved in cell wall biosynthesis
MLSVLFATYNGGKILPAVLSAYSKQNLPKNEWKLIIVDNGSNDNTKEVVNQYVPLLPITLLSEPRKGKNVALNTGLSQIEGDLTVFTDDDVFPHVDWLKELREAADSHPSYSIFGGPILPKWESLPEDWILSWVPLKPTYALLNDQEEGDHGRKSAVFGPNMAVRSSIFQMGYKYDEGVGPKGLSYAMGSETEFLRRLLKDGFKVWYCKNAIVEHFIRSSQMEKGWVLARAIRYGRGSYRLGMVGIKYRAYFQGIPLYLYLEILNKVYRLGKAKLSGNAEGIFKERWNLNYLFGIALEARNIYKESKNGDTQRP